MRFIIHQWIFSAAILITLKAFLVPEAHAAGIKAVRSSGVLLWGADAEGGAPFVFPDPDRPDRLIGFEVDIADALAGELNVVSRPVQNDWDTLIPALKRGDFHMALNGIEWTEERAREVNFSQPYYFYSQQLTVRKEESDIHSFQDLKGKMVGTLGGTVAQAMLERTDSIQVKIYEGQVEPYRDLALGRVDAVLLDFPIAAYYGQTHPKLRFVGEPFGEGAYVIAIRKKDTGLLSEINRAIDRLIYTGKLRARDQKWNLWNERQNQLGVRKTNPRRVYDNEKHDPLSLYASLLLKGAGMTVLISTLAMGLAVVLGSALTVMRRSGLQTLSLPATLYVEVFRGTPLLLQLYIIYFGLPEIGIRLNAFAAAVIALGVNYAAYEAEIYRSGLDSLPRGQTEAATILGMKPFLIYRRILIPQAVRIILPPSTNNFIALFKDSSLVSIIAIVELTKTYNMLAISSMRFLELGLLTATLYLMMSLPLSRFSRRMEKRIQTV